MKHGFIFFEPQRKLDNKIWTTRNARRPFIAKRPISVKKVILTVFFDINGPIIQISVPRGQTVTVTFYKRKILGKLNKCFEKRRSKTGLRGVRLLHDNAPLDQRRFISVRFIYPLTVNFRLKHVKCRVNLVHRS